MIDFAAYCVAVVVVVPAAAAAAVVEVAVVKRERYPLFVSATMENSHSLEWEDAVACV